MRTRIVLSLLAAVLLAMASLTATPTPAQAQSSTEAVFDKGAFLLGNLEKGGATTPGGTVWAFANSFKTPKDDDRIERLRSLHLAGGYGSGHTVSIHADSSGLPGTNLMTLRYAGGASNVGGTGTHEFRTGWDGLKGLGGDRQVRVFFEDHRWWLAAGPEGTAEVPPSHSRAPRALLDRAAELALAAAFRVITEGMDEA